MSNQNTSSKPKPTAQEEAAAKAKAAEEKKAAKAKKAAEAAAAKAKADEEEEAEVAAAAIAEHRRKKAEKAAEDFAKKSKNPFSKVNAKGKGVKVRFLKSPTGVFKLGYSVGDIVAFPANQAQLLLDLGYAEKA